VETIIFEKLVNIQLLRARNKHLLAQFNDKANRQNFCIDKGT